MKFFDLIFILFDRLFFTELLKNKIEKTSLLF